MSKEALLLPEAIPHPEALLLDVELWLCIILTDAQCYLSQQPALALKHSEANPHPVAS